MEQKFAPLVYKTLSERFWQQKTAESTAKLKNYIRVGRITAELERITVKLKTTTKLKTTAELERITVKLKTTAELEESQR